MSSTTLVLLFSDVALPELNLLYSFQIGKVEEAADDCSRAIDLDEDYLRAYQRRAQ